MEGYPQPPSHHMTQRPIPLRPSGPIITSGPTRSASDSDGRGDTMLVSSPLIAQTKDQLPSGLTNTLDHIVGQV